MEKKLAGKSWRKEREKKKAVVGKASDHSETPVVDSTVTDKLERPVTPDCQDRRPESSTSNLCIPEAKSTEIDVVGDRALPKKPTRITVLSRKSESQSVQACTVAQPEEADGPKQLQQEEIVDATIKCDVEEKNELKEENESELTEEKVTSDEFTCQPVESNICNEKELAEFQSTVNIEDNTNIQSDCEEPSSSTNAVVQSSSSLPEIPDQVEIAEITIIENEEIEPQLTQEDEEQLAKEKQLKEDQEVLYAYISEAGPRLQERAHLRATNLAVAKERQDLDTSGLDSSLKKNTTFVKKLRNFTESQFALLEKELLCLNLTRYVSEAANALLEARLKMTDVPLCVLLCSALHQRYGDFASALLVGCNKMLKEKPDDKVCNLSKLRVDLRLYAEFVSAGIFSQKEGLPLLGSVLTNLVNNDKKEHRNASVIVSFCRYCGEDYMGLVPARVLAAANALGREAELPRSKFLPAERHKNVRTLMKDYYQSLTQHTLQQHQLIQREERHNRRLLESRGEVDEARLATVAGLVATLDRLRQQAVAMAEQLQEEVLQLPQDKPEGEEGGLVLGEDGSLSTLSGAEVGNLWEDDDSRAFYTCLPQLKALLPSILYTESEKSGVGGADAQTDAKGDTESGEAGAAEAELEADGELLDANQLAEKEEEEDRQDNENEDASAASSASAKAASQKLLFAGFLNVLPTCISRDLMDTAALEFCLKFNIKPLRRKLARALFLVPRHRQDLLPFYARFIASLQPLMPDLPQDLLERLKMDFRYQVKVKNQVNLESKVKVCRFLGELVKFGVFPGTDCLACLRLLLNDFRHHHIEMACAVLETAGKFLYRSPSTHHRTKVLLEQMMRKKTVMSFEHRYVTMIENAYYHVNPPACSQLLRVEPLPPLLQYVRHLLTERLSKSTVEKVLRMIRKLDWTDTATADFCVCGLTASWDVKYYNIRCLANLVSGLVLYHEWVGPAVVDGVLEDIRVGLECNSPTFNQRRISAVKYLAELYNYKVIESAVIFKVLYSLISFGAGQQEQEQELDPPEQLLRLTLVVTILDTCGVFFSSGHSKRKLDCFITYFQYYYLYKRAVWCGSDAFPVEYDQAVQGCLGVLRAGLQLHDTLEQAQQAVTALNTQLIAKALMQAPELRKYFGSDDANSLATIAENESGEVVQFNDVLDDGDYDDDDEQDRGYEDDGSEHQRRRGGEQDDYEDELSDYNAASEDDSTSQDNTQPDQPPALSLQPIHCEEDDDFQSAYERLLSDALLEHAREARPPPAPLALLPVATRHVAKKTYDQLLDESRSQEEEQDQNYDKSTGAGVVQFVLMSRSSGGRQQQGQQLTTIAVPEDSEMVTKMRSREKEKEEERRNVKRVTLEITERQEEEEAALEQLQQRNSVANLNRERRVKYLHPKGAPDADLIFGSGRHKGTPPPGSNR